MAGKIKDVTFPDGQTRRVEILDFGIIKEDWNEYSTTAGIKIRMKQVAQKIYWIVDDKDNRIYSPDGEPLLAVFSQNIVNAVEI